MYLSRVSLDLFTRNFSRRLSFMSVMKTRDAWILLSQTSPMALFFIFSSNIATTSAPDGPGKDCVGNQDTKEDLIYRDGQE